MGHNTLINDDPRWVQINRERIAAICRQKRHTIRDVIDTLHLLQEPLEQINITAAHFNLLYREVTERVEEFDALGLYQNPEFLRTLDVHFANRYLRALAGWALCDRPVPAAWMLVFEPEDHDLHPTQYAALGVNAHINLDLAMALISTCNTLGIEPVEGSAEHHDFLLVNEVFYELIPPLRRIFKGFRTHASLLDALEMWIVEVVIDETRDQAWDEACRFWRKRHRDGYLKRREEKLDFTACLFAAPIRSDICRDALILGTPEENPTFRCECHRRIPRQRRH